FHRAIGESGAILGAMGPMKTLAEAEATGAEFTQAAYGTSSLEALRGKSAQELLDATLKQPRPRFSVMVDGYVLPADGRSIFSSGKQAHVPLLAGWNKDEGSYKTLLGADEPT